MIKLPLLFCEVSHDFFVEPDHMRMYKGLVLVDTVALYDHGSEVLLFTRLKIDEFLHD